MGRPQTVIVAVPDEGLSQALQRHLASRPGVAVRSAHSMDEVLLPVLDGDGDLVILDLELPDAGKARAVEVLRRASSSLVLVVISSDEDLDRGREVLRHGVFYYGIKPVPEAELLAGVDQALVYCAGRRAGIG